MGKRKPKKINRKLFDKMEIQIAKIMDHIGWPLNYAYDDPQTWESLSKKQRRLLREFFEYAEAQFAVISHEINNHVDDEGNIKPKRKRRCRRSPLRDNPPRSLSDLPPLSSILESLFYFRPPLPKSEDKWPEEIDA